MFCRPATNQATDARYTAKPSEPHDNQRERLLRRRVYLFALITVYYEVQRRRRGELSDTTARESTLWEQVNLWRSSTHYQSFTVTQPTQLSSTRRRRQRNRIHENSQPKRLYRNIRQRAPCRHHRRSRVLKARRDRQGDQRKFRRCTHNFSC